MDTNDSLPKIQIVSKEDASESEIEIDDKDNSIDISSSLGSA